MATNQFAGPITRMPVLGRLAIACAVWLVLIDFTAARLAHRLAAWHSTAVAQYRPAWPRDLRTTATTSACTGLAVFVGVVLPGCAFIVAATVLATDTRTTAIATISAVPAALLLFGLAALHRLSLTTSARRSRATARRVAATAGIPAIEIAWLAGSRGSGGTTVLARAGLAAIDQAGVIAFAIARTQELGVRYRALGFSTLVDRAHIRLPSCEIERSNSPTTAAAVTGLMTPPRSAIAHHTSDEAEPAVRARTPRAGEQRGHTSR